MERIRCSSETLQTSARAGKDDVMCCRIRPVLKVLPSSAASTKSSSVENRRALNLEGNADDIFRYYIGPST